MGRLERKLNTDLIDLIEAGWTPKQKRQPIKTTRKPRKGESYRGARRNAARGSVWVGARAVRPIYGNAPIRLNRSRKWDGVPLTKPYR